MLIRSSPTFRHFLADSVELFSETVTRTNAAAEEHKKTAKSSFFMGFKKMKNVFVKAKEGDALRLSSKETEHLKYLESLQKEYHNLSTNVSRYAKSKNGLFSGLSLSLPLTLWTLLMNSYTHVGLAKNLDGVSEGFKAFSIIESDVAMSHLFTEVSKSIATDARLVEQTSFSLDGNVGDTADFLSRNSRAFHQWISARPDAQQLHEYASEDLAESIAKREKTTNAKKIDSLNEEIKKVTSRSHSTLSYMVKYHYSTKRLCSSRRLVLRV